MTRVYLDNAASTPIDAEVLDYMLPYLRDDYGNPSSVHEHGRKLRAVIERSRKEIAAEIGAAPAEIFFMSGGTEADNMAIKSSVIGLGLEHIVTTRVEHHAVVHCVEEFEKMGKKVTWLPVDEIGHPDLKALEETLKTGPRALVTLMHANNEMGTLLDMDACAAICSRYDAVFHSDTVQSMGNVPFDLSKTAVTFLSASAHKFYGPKGVGFMYMQSGTKIPSLICGGSQERNMRAGTEPVASIAAMAFALKKCYRILDQKNAHISALRLRMWEGLQKHVPGIQLNTSLEPGKSIPTVLNVAFPGGEGDSMLLFNLDINGISASGGSACTSGSVKGSHVLTGIGMPPERAANSIRFSFGKQNTMDEIDYAVAQVAKFAGVTA